MRTPLGQQSISFDRDCDVNANLMVTFRVRRAKIRGPMPDIDREPVVRWKLRYDSFSETSEILLPHAWRQDIPLTVEGPVLYECVIKAPRGVSHLYFQNVSYQAEVFLDDTLVLVHQGIWDAFAVPLDRFAGKSVRLTVRVTKNGGASFPVKQVASGFLPYVFNTFGGIFGIVELVHGAPVLEQRPTAPRVSVRGNQIFLDGQPFYIRGILHWGWYPELGHPNPSDSTIREEVQAIKSRGFNLVKFCLWVPSHRYLEILRQEGLEAWIELPLWNPSPNEEKLGRIANELEQIVRQYRGHDNVIAWTVGCELGEAVPAAFRAKITQLVRNLTGCPLVKDSSGGSEMYGGDPREFGSFSDFHPYCDLPFYPAVLDTLLPGPRASGPVILGEFNDVDVHRDLARLGDELPYWCSSLSELNDRGVRWQYDLPSVVADSRFSNHPTKNRHSVLMESSRRKSLFIRKTVHEAVRARDSIAGYVVTGLRDTPISSSGFLDDWAEARFTTEECEAWNGETTLFLIPGRKPSWMNGGNRPGWVDPYNRFVGLANWRIGIHSSLELEGGLVWKLMGSDGTVAAEGAEDTSWVPPLRSTEIGRIVVELSAGAYTLVVEFSGVTNQWPIWIVGRPEWNGVSFEDSMGRLGEIPGGAGQRDGLFRVSTVWNDASLTILTEEGTKAAPFWREAAYEFLNDDFWAMVPFAEQWSRLLPICSDRVLDEAWLKANVGEYEVILNRVDTRTYVDTPVMVRGRHGIVSTLRPFGGLGVQPPSLNSNPAGVEFIRAVRLFER